MEFCQEIRPLRGSWKAPYPETPSTRRHWRENPPDERYSGTISLAPRIYEGGGPRSGGGSPPAAAGTALSVTASPCQLSQRESQGSCAPFLPPAFMRGEGRAAAGKASSVTASPCQLPQRGSRGCCAPFLPLAFMRGEGHAVAGGVPRRSGGESLLSHGFAVPALPEGEPRELRSVPAPRIYEGGEGHAVAGGVPRGAAKKPPPRFFEGAGMFSLPFV